MKKALSVCLVLCCLVTMLFGCGNKENATAKTAVRVGSLKGPTSIGLVNLMKANEEGSCEGKYEFTMETQADVLAASITRGDLDIALVPANVASVLYKKTDGNIYVIDINTLGVLYFVSDDDSITSITDLKGKTIYLTGEGTTPDFVLQYLLSNNAISKEDVNIEYCAEASEALNALNQNKGSVALLPQPFATVATIQNESLKIVINTNDSWAETNEDSNVIVTGVTIVNKAFADEHPEAVKAFMNDHKASVDKVNADVQTSAELTVNYGIIEKAPVAAKAIPYCNITYMDGEAMKVALSGYLKIIASYDIKFVGGELPGDEFYYLK